MKSTILPLAAGAIIGSLSVLTWQDMRSFDATSRGEILSVPAKGRTGTSKFNNMRVVSATPPDTIADADEKPPGHHPNLKRLMLLDELKQNKKLNISIPIIDESGKFNLNFKELFGLTDDQVSDIEGDIRMLRMQMTAEMIDHARVTKEPRKISIEIPQNENAAGYYDRFMDMMQGHLGVGRFPAFYHFSGKQFATLFNGYGAEELNVTFEYFDDKITDGKIIVTEERTTKAGPMKKTFECPSMEIARGRYPGLEKYLDN